MANTFVKIGYKGTGDFVMRFILPILLTCSIFALGVMYFLTLPFWVPLMLLGIGVFFIIVYPILVLEKDKVSINENIHLFITYAGTISTIDLDRTTFFKKIALKEKYGYISRSAQKALYLAKDWNLGFPQTLRKIALLSPSKIFADFLDRFAAIMDFGGDMQTFLHEEQEAVYRDYAVQYKQALNNISMLREVFIAITISVAFSMSVALLLPLLEGVSILIAVRWSLAGLLFIDILLIILISGFIPKDNLTHNLKHKDKGMRRINTSFMLVAPVSLTLFLVLYLYTNFSFLFVFAFSITPFMITGYYATKEENDVFRRDKAFPSFIRALGSTIYARQGGVVSSLQALRVHDFGVLNEMVINLYKRLKVGSDRDRSWYYFAAETGSNLINYFVHIFSESVYLGGHSQKIGQIISTNFSKLMDLRSLRKQQAGSLRGALYGALVGFIATVYITVSITSILAQMFSGAFVSTSSSGQIGGLVSSIIPPIPEVDNEAVALYIAIIVISHSFFSSLIIKIVDGGHKMAFFFDFTLMVWIGAVLSWVIPKISQQLFLPAVGAG